MKRKGSIMYELTEEEYNQATYAIQNIDQFMNNEDYGDYAKREAYEGIETLKRVFGQED